MCNEPMASAHIQCYYRHASVVPHSMMINDSCLLKLYIRLLEMSLMMMMLVRHDGVSVLVDVMMDILP